MIAVCRLRLFGEAAGGQRNRREIRTCHYKEVCLGKAERIFAGSRRNPLLSFCPRLAGGCGPPGSGLLRCPTAARLAKPQRNAVESWKTTARPFSPSKQASVLMWPGDLHIAWGAKHLVFLFLHNQTIEAWEAILHIHLVDQTAICEKITYGFNLLNWTRGPGIEPQHLQISLKHGSQKFSPDIWLGSDFRNAGEPTTSQSCTTSSTTRR